MGLASLDPPYDLTFRGNLERHGVRSLQGNFWPEELSGIAKVYLGSAKREEYGK